MSNVLVCEQLCKHYGDGDIQTQVLDKLNLTVNKGELLAIVGSSGSGKSTFLHLAGALDRPSSGKVLIDGHDIYAMSEKQQAQFRNKHIGFIYQFHHLMMEFSAIENVAMPLLIAGVSVEHAKDRAIAMLRTLMPALVELRDKGVLNIYPSLIGEYISVSKFMDLSRNHIEVNGIHYQNIELSDRVLMVIKTFLKSLPGFNPNLAPEKQAEEVNRQLRLNVDLGIDAQFGKTYADIH